MVDKKEDGRDFISYLDDDGQKKDQHVLIIERTDYGVEFKFNPNETNTIFIPWHRILKIKEKGQGIKNDKQQRK